MKTEESSAVWGERQKLGAKCQEQAPTTPHCWSCQVGLESTSALQNKPLYMPCFESKHATNDLKETNNRINQSDFKYNTICKFWLGSHSISLLSALPENINGITLSFLREV